MNKATLNFVAVCMLRLTQALQKNNSEQKNEAEHPTSNFL